MSVTRSGSDKRHARVRRCATGIARSCRDHDLQRTAHDHPRRDRIDGDPAQGSRCMGAMSRTFRDSWRARARTRAAGFSLIELMITLSVGGIVVTMAAPSFGPAIADIHARSTAQELAGALRLARISAVTRNRPAAFMLADATPVSDATTTVNASRWFVKLLPSAPQEAVEHTALILATADASQERVILTGPAQVCFDALGLQMAPPDASSACAQPGGATSYLVSRTGGSRQYKVRVYRTGRVDICDTARTHGKDLDGCR